MYIVEYVVKGIAKDRRYAAIEDAEAFIARREAQYGEAFEVTSRYWFKDSDSDTDDY